MPDQSATWSLIAHGGAKDIAPHEDKANREGLKEAIAAGSQILENGGTAVEAVVEVVRLLELNPAYNAGLYGSVLTEEGAIEMDASLMDGTTLDIGAVAGLTDIEHPVLVAKALLRDKAIFLIGAGAMKFAKALGLVLANPPAAKPAFSPGCDTVGCVARDTYGAVAAATSTGGLENTRAGRVGDVPLPGCGFYADNTRGAVSASGEGESIARVLLASECVRQMETMDPNQATSSALQALARVNGEAGLIAVDADGTLGWAHNSRYFAVGMACRNKPGPHVYLAKSEDDAAYR